MKLNVFHWRMYGWWHRSLALSVTGLVIGCALALLAALIASQSFSASTSAARILLLLLPLGFVLLMGIVARIQERIDLRGTSVPPSATNIKS